MGQGDQHANFRKLCNVETFFACFHKEKVKMESLLADVNWIFFEHPHRFHQLMLSDPALFGGADSGQPHQQVASFDCLIDHLSLGLTT